MLRSLLVSCLIVIATQANWARADDLDDDTDAVVATGMGMDSADTYTFSIEHDVTGTGKGFKARNDVSYTGSVDIAGTKKGARPTLRVSKFAFSPEDVDSIEVRG
jgi:hypothetical protein